MQVPFVEHRHIRCFCGYVFPMVLVLIMEGAVFGHKQGVEDADLRTCSDCVGAVAGPGCPAGCVRRVEAGQTGICGGFIRGVFGHVFLLRCGAGHFGH